MELAPPNRRRWRGACITSSPCCPSWWRWWFPRGSWRGVYGACPMISGISERENRDAHSCASSAAGAPGRNLRRSRGIAAPTCPVSMIRQNRDLRPSQRSDQNPKRTPPTAAENGTSFHVQRYRRAGPLQLGVGRQPVGRVGGCSGDRCRWRTVFAGPAARFLGVMIAAANAAAFRFRGSRFGRWA
jgi:hypothetical protein